MCLWCVVPYGKGLDSSIISEYFLRLMIWCGFTGFWDLKVCVQMVLEEGGDKLES